MKGMKKTKEKFDRYFAHHPKASAVWERIERAHSEPHRCHHNGRHIEENSKLIEQYVQELGLTSDDEIVLDLINMTHDIIYQCVPVETYLKNEERSTKVAQLFMAALEVPNTIQDRVIQGIEATKTHLSTNDSTLDLFLDIDMSPLAGVPRPYFEYAQDTMDEFVGAGIPQDLYVEKRGEFLRSYIGQPVFITQYFSHLNETAWANMESEAKKLEKSEPFLNAH